MDGGAAEASVPHPPAPDAHGLPRTLKAIAAAQVWGAATGTWYVVQLLLSSPSQSSLIYIILLLVLVFYTGSGISALYLLRGRRWAFEALAAAQIPQLIRLQSPSFVYTLISGVYGLVYAGPGGAGVNFGILSTFSIRWGDLNLPTTFGFNVVAAVTLWYLAVIYPARAAAARRFPLRPTDEPEHRGEGPPLA